MTFKPTDSIPLGVVLERRRIDNPWQDYAWRAVAVIPGSLPLSDWQVLREVDGGTQYFAGTLELELFQKETEGYRFNLLQTPPKVYVVLRPEEEGEVEADVVPFHVTVCPYEAQDYEDSGDEIVDGVAMPDDIIAWVEDFVSRHHVDVPFKKRKRKAYDPAKGAFGRRRAGDGEPGGS